MFQVFPTCVRVESTRCELMNQSIFGAGFDPLVVHTKDLSCPALDAPLPDTRTNCGFTENKKKIGAVRFMGVCTYCVSLRFTKHFLE